MQANNLAPLHKYFSSVYLQEPVSLTRGRMAEGLWASDQLTFLQNSATAVTATCTPYSAQWNSVGLLTILSRSTLNNMEIYSNYVIKWGKIMILRSMTDRHTLQVIKNHHLCHHLISAIASNYFDFFTHCKYFLLDCCLLTFFLISFVLPQCFAFI